MVVCDSIYVVLNHSSNKELVVKDQNPTSALIAILEYKGLNLIVLALVFCFYMFLIDLFIFCLTLVELRAAREVKVTIAKGV